MFLASNDGWSVRAVDDDYNPTQGEVLFSDFPSPEELRAAFPAYDLGLVLSAERRDALRAAAYRERSDPLFFKWQRGEATQQQWLDEVAAIKAAVPKS